jgi:maltooligosyltrehalose trehalohydrolase
MTDRAVHAPTERSRSRVWHPSFGAIPIDNGVRFRVWATRARQLTLLLRRGDGLQRLAPVRGADGIWELFVPDVPAGSQYAYVLDDGTPLPDPTSRFQPDGVHGWSEVVDPLAYDWTDASWIGVDPRRVAIYELHVGTFSESGTFAGVREHLEYLRDLGVTAIELMPLADFPGRRNWGYDGASLFAPARAYGRPDDLRALVDRAHGTGLAVLFDVVYNHLGPEGAYLPHFSPDFLTGAHETPWGSAVNLDREGSATVRRLLLDNALHWIHEYHADGLRLDATHALFDDGPTTFVPELARAIHAARTPRPFVFAEDHRNLATMVASADVKGWNLDGVWADDFHHVIRRMLGGDAHGYFVDYEGTAEELAAILRRGWLYVGQMSARHRAPRGTDPSHVPMRTSIVCVQNHDQIGNRAFGDRLHHSADAAAWRAAITLLLTVPMTPLLFMGQEWAASTPFQFFTDFGPDLGRLVSEGRKREFQSFPEFADPNMAAQLPDPQSDATFAASRLRWIEQTEPEHAASLALHRTLLQLRSAHPALQASDATLGDARALDRDTVLVTRQDPDGSSVYVICARLRGSGTVACDLERSAGWRTLLTTEDSLFATDSRPPTLDLENGSIAFQRPGAIIVERALQGAS